MRTRLVGVLVLLALPLVSCGDDGDDGDAAPTTISTTSPDEPAHADEGAEERAEAIVLKLGDLPDAVEWSSAPAETDGEAEDAFRTCVGLSPDSDLPSADSPTFSAGDVTTVDSSAAIAPSEAAIDEVLDALEAPKAVECAEERFKSAVAQNDPESFGAVETSRVDYPDVGDRATAIRISTTVENDDGEPVPVHFDLIAVKQGDVGITLTLVNAPEPFPVELSAQLAETMAERAA